MRQKFDKKYFLMLLINPLHLIEHLRDYAQIKREATKFYYS